MIRDLWGGQSNLEGPQYIKLWEEFKEEGGHHECRHYKKHIKLEISSTKYIIPSKITTNLPTSYLSLHFSHANLFDVA